jgi:maltose alpha-D-glucosyltransferase/alpha-amylase
MQPSLPLTEVEAIAWQWRDWTSERFLAAYADAIGPESALAIDDDLLGMFVLQKALYEIGYESANRPTWVSTPVRGVLALLGGAKT